MYAETRRLSLRGYRAAQKMDPPFQRGRRNRRLAPRGQRTAKECDRQRPYFFNAIGRAVPYDVKSIAQFSTRDVRGLRP